MEKHTHTITRGNKTYTVNVRQDGEEYYVFTADLDPEVDPADPHMLEVGGISNIVHAFAEWQLNMPSIVDDPVVSFDDDEGTLIVCPWYDSSGRIPLSTIDAVRRYGVQNVAKFISEAVIFLFDLKEVETNE